MAILHPPHIKKSIECPPEGGPICHVLMREVVWYKGVKYAYVRREPIFNFHRFSWITGKELEI